jgi:putative NADPH-quinone reductase
MPSITKGLIDRVFLPGFAFKHHKGKDFPEKLMKGKSIRMLVTMDAPKIWFYIIYRAAQYRTLKQLVFGYVGFDSIRFTTFGFMRNSTPKQRQNWLKKVEVLGKKLT